MHHLCELDQADRCGELRVFHRRGDARRALRARQACRQFENFRGEMIDAIEKTASASDENAGADIVEIRFLVQPAFEQLERFAQSQVNDRVQRLALDLFTGKTGIVLEQNHFARETIAEDAAAFFDL